MAGLLTLSDISKNRKYDSGYKQRQGILMDKRLERGKLGVNSGKIGCCAGRYKKHLKKAIIRALWKHH